MFYKETVIECTLATFHIFCSSPFSELFCGLKTPIFQMKAVQTDVFSTEGKLSLLLLVSDQASDYFTAGLRPDFWIIFKPPLALIILVPLWSVHAVQLWKGD